MNVVMPQIAPSPAPTPVVSSPSVGNATAPTKFSSVLAQAQDANAPATPQALNGNNAPKTPAKGDKNSGKSSTGNAHAEAAQTPVPTTNVAHPAISLTSVPVLATKLSLTQNTASDDEGLDEADSIAAPASDAATGLNFPSELSTLPDPAGAATMATKADADFSKSLADLSEPTSSDELETKKADVPRSEKNAQQAIATSTAQLGTSAAEAIVKATNIAGFAAATAPDSASTKYANVSSKSSPANSSGHQVAIPRANGQLQTQLASLQSQPHAETPAPTVPAKADTSNGDQAKSNSQTTATGNKPADVTKRETGASDATNKENPLLHNAAVTENASSNSTTQSTASTGSSTAPSTTQISTPAQVQAANVGVFSKSSAVPGQAQSVANAEAVEAAQEIVATAATSALHAAKLVAGLEQSELRVGLHAGEFGNVDIRTSLARNQFTAEISVERGELGRVLAAELPALQHRFAEQQLPQANITLQQHASGESSDFRQGGRQQQNAPTNDLSGSVHEESFLPLIATAETRETTGLDIHM